MQAFLEAAGVVVLILVALLLVAGVLVGLAVFRPILAQVGEATLGSVPAEIELVPVDDGAWPDAELRERLRAALEREGFVSCGTYRIDPLEKQWVTLLVGADRGTSAAVLNHPLAGTWVDLWAIDRDGRTLTHTTCPGAGALARAPWSRRVVRPAAPITNLVARFRRDLPASVQPITADTARSSFEEDWRRHWQNVIDDELLARLEMKERHREAWEKVSAARADRLAAARSSAGAKPDRDRILAVLRGEGREDDPRPRSLDDPWVDVPDLFAALGVDGIAEWLPTFDETEDDDEESDAEEVQSDDEIEIGGSGEPGRRRWSKARVACSVFAALALCGTVAGGVLGARTGSWLVAVGGAGIGAALPFAVVLFGFVVRFVPLLVRVLRRWLRRDASLGREDLRMRVELTGRLEPSRVRAVRILLADWGDVASRLLPRRERPGLLGRLYEESVLPNDAGGRALVARLERGEAPDALAERIGSLRLRLLDTEIAGEATGALAAELGVLCDELIGSRGADLVSPSDSGPVDDPR
jgi:hypothetical protein